MGLSIDGERKDSRGKKIGKEKWCDIKKRSPQELGLGLVLLQLCK